MIVEDVKLLGEGVESPKTPPFQYCRPLEIITDNGNIKTPYKTTNKHEHLARSEIPILKVLPNEIVSNFKLLDNTMIEAFYNNTGKNAKRLLDVVKQFNDITRRSKLRISIFQPLESILLSWNSAEKIAFADTQAEYFQSKLNSDLITYPFLELPLSEYLAFIDERYSGNEKQSTIFTLDMAMNSNYLKQILDHLQEKREAMIIALIHRKWSDTIPQHTIINSYFNNPKMIFMACQVDRINEETGATSNTHAITVGSNFDIVALKQSRGFPVKQTLNLNKIKFFAPDTLRIDNLEATFTQQRNFISEFNLPADDYLDQIHLTHIINGRNGAKIHSKKYQILFYLARVHEAITSAAIFAKEHEMILEKRIQEHILNTDLQYIPMISR